MKLYPVVLSQHDSAHASLFKELERSIFDNQTSIEAWFRDQWQNCRPIITCSVDLRNAGFKVTSVDSNLFPAGFNNLNPDFLPLAIQAFQHHIDTYYPQCKNILIVPENHTRNEVYYQSLATLESIVSSAGYQVKVGSWFIDDPISISLPNQSKLTLFPLRRVDDQLVIENFSPCLILLNNDLSGGLPEWLTDLKQTVVPTVELGWHVRSKERHFLHYEKVCSEFSNLIHIDSWKIAPYFSSFDKMELRDPSNQSLLLAEVESLFEKIEKKYQQYNILSEPFVILKPDSGTYGRGIITLRSPHDVMSLNRKQLHNLTHGKNHHHEKKILLQEGIPTIEKMNVNQASAEPVLYLFGQHVIGGFYRVHPLKKIDENLNSPGMQFAILPFNRCCNSPDWHLDYDAPSNRYYFYSVIARLALLASSQEQTG